MASSLYFDIRRKTHEFDSRLPRGETIYRDEIEKLVKKIRACKRSNANRQQREFLERIHTRWHRRLTRIRTQQGSAIRWVGLEGEPRVIGKRR